MEISKLKTLAIPSLNDVLPILDINGGVNGKPILRKATLSSVLALAGTDNNQNSSSFVIPDTIKTIAANTDYFIGIDSQGIAYKISKFDLLAGLSTGGTSTGGTSTGGNSTNDPYFSDVVLLSQYDSDFSDVIGRNVISIGSPIIDNSIFKFGNGSLKLPGNSGLSIQSNSAWNFTSDFTIEFFVRFSNTVGQQALITNYPNSGSGWAIQLYNGKFHASFHGDGSCIDGTLEVLANTWYYVAVTRVGSAFRLFINGEQDGNTYNDYAALAGQYLQIGSIVDSAFFNGNIDSLRITKRARTITSIPNQAFPSS